MSKFAVQLPSYRQVADRTAAFHFKKPAGFEFKPGQAIDLVLPGPHPDENSSDARHTFSLVSAPHDGELVIATRMRDSTFKRALSALPIGSELLIDGPFGSLTLHRNTARAAVLIAGGIGVTPFMSMVQHAATQQTPQELLLIYSNRRPEDTAFLPELQQLERHYAGFRLIATMTDMAHSARKWQGATQRIDGAWIKQLIQGMANPIFYVSGSPAMVAAMCPTLVAAGIDEDDVRSEQFYGY